MSNVSFNTLINKTTRYISQRTFEELGIYGLFRKRMLVHNCWGRYKTA